MPLDIAKVLKKAWADFIGTLGFESAADVIYSACFDAAPTLQGLFKTPRSFMSLRLMQGITNIINLSENPPAMKAAVETLGSRHFDRDPQAVRVTVLQEAMVSAVQEVFPLSPKGRLALVAVLNYIGGGNCYITREYYGRIKIISNSWKIANNKEMFSFNSAVMGFGRHSTWMHLILDQFDDIVVHAADSYRLQEECDILSLVLAQHAGTMNLTEFKAIMLASLRSLLPKAGQLRFVGFRQFLKVRGFSAFFFLVYLGF
ncbi:unnamed protein product [Symbiodinium sp. CCMP2456]|nr:unnamed protein product [Symbiodinium sp. CCMP2456]